MTTFHDPREFLTHLERMAALPRDAEQDKTLLLASVHVIRYLLESQTLLSAKMMASVDCLNSVHDTWGHKLAELYQILEAGDVDADTMNQILVQEVCGASAGT